MKYKQLFQIYPANTTHYNQDKTKMRRARFGKRSVHLTYKDLHDEMVNSVHNGEFGHLNARVKTYLENTKSTSSQELLMKPLDIAKECESKTGAFDVKDGKLMRVYHEAHNKGDFMSLSADDVPSVLCSSAYETIQGEDGHPVILGQGRNGVTFLGRCKDSNKLVVFKLSWNKRAFGIVRECGLQKRAYDAMNDADEGELVAKVPKLHGVLKFRELSPYRLRCNMYIVVSEFIGFLPKYPATLTWQKAVELNEEMSVFEDREFNDMFCSLIRLTELIMKRDMMHADIKSDNILISIIEGKPVPFLIDYGNSLEQIQYTKSKQEHNKKFLDPFIFLCDAPPKTADMYSVMILMDKSTAKMKRMSELGDVARDFMKQPLEGRCDHKEMISRIADRK